MADFSAPQTGNTASSIGLFDESGGDGQQQGGDLFSAGGQADLFGGETAGNRIDTVEVDLASGIQSGAQISGIGAKSTATPPPRPPPPTAGSNGTPRAVSPSVTAGAHASAASKSAFDDLNDSIRMALGGSPSRPSPAVQQTPHVQQLTQQQLTQQQGFGVFDVSGSVQAGTGQPVVGTVPGYAVPPTHVPVGYGSPVKQPIAGDGN